MKKILIIGATSAIAKASARLWAARGDALFVVARDGAQLDVIVNDLRVRGSPQVASFTMDANDTASHAVMLEQAFLALGAVDVALIAYGTLSDQSACEQDVNLTLREIGTNGVSVVCLMTALANRLEQQRSGTLAVISSVAGDRGRQSNYVYGSAKALVSAFASGLRQRLYKSGVAVLTIKPGFVDTPMTAAFRKGPLWASADNVGARIVRACDGRNGDIYAPGFWWGIMAIIKSIPTAVFVRLKL